MSTSPSPLLVRVDPRAVATDPSLLQPTAWDRKVVLDDLRKYVSRTRQVNATPRLQVRDGRLFVVSGLPFLIAARDAVPPLSEVVCEIAGRLGEVQQANLQQVSVGDILNAMPPIYRSTEMLFFRRSLTSQERQAVEIAIARFFQEVTSPEWMYGGQYRHMEHPEWNEAHDIITWTWEKSESEGHDMILLLQQLRNISSNIASIRSYNGISLLSLFNTLTNNSPD